MVSSQISLGGGGVQANNYTLDGVPITDMRGFPVLNPTIEAISRRQGSGAHLRRRDGRAPAAACSTRRRARAATSSTARRSIRTARCGASRSNTSRTSAARPRQSSGLSESFYQPLWRRRRRADRQEPHVLLVCDRRLPRSGDSGLEPDVAERAAAHRRFFDDHAQRRAGADLQPVLSRRRRHREVSGDRYRLAGDGRRVHGRDHSGERIRRPTRWRSRWPAIGRAAAVQREQPRRTSTRPSTFPTSPTCSRSKASTSSRDKSSLSGLFIYNQTQEPAASPRPRRPVVPGARRQLADSAPQGLRAEQHQCAQRHDGGELPLRLHRVSGRPELQGRIAGTRGVSPTASPRSDSARPI